MTIPSETNRVQYDGNGSNTAFSFTFPVFSTGEIDVYVTDESASPETTVLKTETTHYTISFAGDLPSGGTVNFITAPASTDRITIVRDVAITQTTDYAENDPFPAASTENALDKLTIVDQQQQEQLDRALVFAVQEQSTFSPIMPSTDEQGGNYIRLKSDGTGLEWASGTVTAGAGLDSIDGVSNSGGNVDLVAGSGITITPDNGAKTITFTATGGSSFASTLNSVSNAGGNVDLTGSGPITITPNDGADQIAIGFSAGSLSNDEISGNKIDGGTISNFASTGIDDNATGTIMTLSTSGLEITNDVTLKENTPVLNLEDSDAGSNAKVWRLDVTTSAFNIRTMTDAYGFGSAAMNITRSGTDVTGMNVFADSTTFNGTVEIAGASDNLKLPRGTTAQRVVGGQASTRYNTDDNKIEYYDGSTWQQLATGTGSGETNTASNVGAGDAEVFKQKTGVDFEFRELAGGTNVTITEGTDTISIACDVVDLSDLSDVTVTTPSDGQVLVYDSVTSAFVNDTISATVNNIDDLGDVSISSAADGDILVYDTVTSQWVNDTLASAVVDQSANYTWTGDHDFQGEVDFTSGHTDPNYFSSSGAQIVRVDGRLFVGDAADHDGRQNGTEVTVDWLETKVDATTVAAQFASLNERGQYAGVFGTRSSDNPTTNASMGTVGVGAFAVADNASYDKSVYSFYGEVYKDSGATSDAIGHGLELAVINQYSSATSSLSTDPYNLNPGGLVEGLRVGAGKPGQSGQVSSTAISIANVEGTSTAKFRRGIIIGSDAISAGGSGLQHAINMAQSHNITWWVSSGNVGPSIRSDVSSASQGLRQIFGNNSWVIQEPVGSTNVFTIDNGGNTAVNSVVSSAPRGALVYRTSNQSISNSTATAIQWQIEDYDNGNWWTSGSSTRLTVPSGISYVRISANVVWAGASGGFRQLSINKNGSSVRGGGREVVDAATGIGHSLNVVSAPMAVSPGDYFEIIVQQNSGSAINITSGNSVYASIEAL